MLQSFAECTPQPHLRKSARLYQASIGGGFAPRLAGSASAATRSLTRSPVLWRTIKCAPIAMTSNGPCAILMRNATRAGISRHAAIGQNTRTSNASIELFRFSAATSKFIGKSLSDDSSRAATKIRPHNPNARLIRHHDRRGVDPASGRPK